jgi:putative ABC transport system permease protein
MHEEARLGRLAWSQLRFRAARTLALLAGILLAATAFTVLTAASSTSQLRTVGTVAAHFSPAYDILVRPKGSRTALESRTGTVQPNFLSGIYGGISMAQYHQIQRIRGVQVAAPIAMVGYTLIRAGIPVLLPAADNARPGRQLYRYSTAWVSAGGAIRVPQPPSFVYVTPDRLGLNSSGQTYEDLPGGTRLTVCPGQSSQPSSPFSPAAQSGGWCWSHVNGSAGAFAISPQPHQAFAIVTWSFPMLIAAIDPAAEAKLDGLNHAVTSGRYLAENAGGSTAGGQPTFPVLAASTSGIGEYAITEVQRLPAPSGPVQLSAATMTSKAAVPGQTVLTVRTTAQQAYRQVLAIASERQPVDSYLTAGAVRYQRSSNGALTPVQVRNPVSVWQLGEATSALLAPPMDETDAQYRSLGGHRQTGSESSGGSPEMRLVGVFNPARVHVFDPLSRVPLGPFQPTTVMPANAATRTALGGGDLLPNLNLGGYVSQPAQLITTLSSLPELQASGAFSGNTHASDPISVIRVRVAGVTGPNPLSLERIREVAQQIAVGTGLDVDIVAGSSPEPTAVNLPAGRYGQPSMELTEGWVKKGIAVAILTAVDKKSVVLFTLVLVVCVLFVANSATAAVRGRRRELGVLACLGWTRPRLFAIVLGELAAIGLAAGVVGAAAALPLSAALGLHASPGRAALAVPVAVAVAVASGAVPAWLASRADPMTSVRPPVLAAGRGHHPGGITAMAILNAMRAPGRSLIGVLSLAVGISSLTLLTAVTVAYRGVVVGSLLGDAVAVQVRGVDYVAVAATVVLGVLAVADVVFLNIRERAAELATIRSFGWRESSLSRLVVTEGVAIGIVGSLAGAALGLAGAAEFAGQLPPGLFAAAGGSAVAGVVVTAAAALLPARLLRRLPAAPLLAED